MVGQVLAHEADGGIAQFMLHAGVAHAQHAVAGVGGAQAPFDVHVVDEEPLVHVTHGVQYRHGDQAAGGDQVLHLDELAGVPAFAAHALEPFQLHEGGGVGGLARIGVARAGGSHRGAARGLVFDGDAQGRHHVGLGNAVVVQQQHVAATTIARQRDAGVLRGADAPVLAQGQQGQRTGRALHQGLQGSNGLGGRSVVDQHDVLDLWLHGLAELGQPGRVGVVGDDDGGDAPGGFRHGHSCPESARCRLRPGIRRSAPRSSPAAAGRGSPAGGGGWPGCRWTRWSPRRFPRRRW